MSNGFEAAVEFELSGQRGWVILDALVFALLMLAVIQTPAASRPLAFAAASAWLVLRRRTRGNGLRRARWTADGALFLERADRRWIAGRLLALEFFDRRLIVLSVEAERQKHRLVVFSNDQPEAARRLRQRLNAGHWRTLNAPLTSVEGD